MTATVQTDTTQMVPETTSERPMREETVQAIVTEVNRKWAKERPGFTCSTELADRTLAKIEDFANQSRTAGYTVIFPAAKWMRTDEYKVMDTIFEHGATAVEGSAADTVNRFVVDPTKDELAFVHDQQDAFPHYCTVRTVVSVVPGLSS